MDRREIKNLAPGGSAGQEGGFSVVFSGGSAGQEGGCSVVVRGGQAKVTILPSEGERGEERGEERDKKRQRDGAGARHAAKRARRAAQAAGPAEPLYGRPTRPLVEGYARIGDLPSSLVPTAMAIAEMWVLLKRHGAGASMVMYGREIALPRLQLVYGEPYRFAGKLNEPSGTLDEFPCLRRLAKWATRDWHARDSHAKALSLRFNTAVINGYRDGGDYIGAHSDKTDSLHPDSIIYSIRLGASRRLRFTPIIRSPSTTTTTTLRSSTHSIPHGSFYTMTLPMQRLYKHSILKELETETRPCVSPSLSITLRVACTN